MSRYPGTQFKVYDKSQVAAIVPVSTANGADAVQYLNAFASVKGPEGITFCYGDSFYEKYGTQNYIDFKKYGQPLFQTSMNINNGAAILAKRAVLDDATLGNATLSVVLTKYKEADLTTDVNMPEEDAMPGYGESERRADLIGKITFSDSDAPIKYSLAPLVFSVNNYKNGEFATKRLDEHKERYDLYKNYITSVVSNEDTPDNRFLSKMLYDNGKATDEWANVLSGFSQSLYYDKDDNVVNVVEEGRSEVRKVTSITTGKLNGQMQTYSSIFDTTDITEDYDRTKIKDIDYNVDFYDGEVGGYTMMKFVVDRHRETPGDDTSPWVYTGGWQPIDKDTEFDREIEDPEHPGQTITKHETAAHNGVNGTTIKHVAYRIASVDSIVDTFDELNDLKDDTWISEEAYESQQTNHHYQYALISQIGDTTGKSMDPTGSGTSANYVLIASVKPEQQIKLIENDGTSNKEIYWTNRVVNDELKGQTVNVYINPTGSNHIVTYKDGTVVNFSSGTPNEGRGIVADTGYTVKGAWVAVPEKNRIKTKGYTDIVRLCNDLLTSRSGYIISEWIFPMFTIFDNGRGQSTKSISIEYDKNTSTTMKKAVYRLTVYNYDTSSKLESFYFSLNPYSTNDNTGYAFDIESAVNYNSNQISAVSYYESFDALLKTLQAITGSYEDLIGTYDILFGHNLAGKYSAYSSYSTSNLLKRVAYVYDYAHLDVFDNDIITVNAYCDSDNMLDTTDEDDFVRYYYYNWIRTNKGLLERLEYGSDGYVLARNPEEWTGNINKSTGTFTQYVVPFFAVDSSNTEIYEMPDAGRRHGDTIVDIMEATGFANGSIISSDTFNLCNKPYIEDNFVTVKLACVAAEMFTPTSGSDHDGTKGDPVYIVPNDKARKMKNVFFADETAAGTMLAAQEAAKEYVTNHPDEYAVAYNNTIQNPAVTIIEVTLPLTPQKLYQRHYYRFYSGEFDRDIFNLDIYFPNAIFDCNYDNNVKLAIQRLVAYRGDLMAYMDMGIDKVRSYQDCTYVIPATDGGLDLTSETSEYSYIRDMHVAVCCLFYKIRNPYDNRVITVTGTYGLSNLYIGHFRNDIGKVFAGISNGIAISNIIYGTVNYIPKIYPTSEMTSLNNIGGVYPSDDATITNEKQLMCDLRVNYGCYYDDRFSIETEYTMNAVESEFSYWNNVALVCMMMQSIRKACPSARYQFITANDLSVYQQAVETAMKPWRNKFAFLEFSYVQDDNALANKIFYAAIKVAFKPFAQAEIFELTALNYATLSSEVTNV